MTPAEPCTCVPHDLLVALAAEARLPTPSLAPGSRPALDPPTAAAGPYTSRLLVDHWLQERGIAFRVKAEPDNLGRTIYVLQQCPFNPDHGDPDACVMQDHHGKLSAQCFHSSCQGQGWQAFKSAIGAPAAHHYDPPLQRRQTRRPKTPRGTALPPSSAADTASDPPPPAALGSGAPVDTASDPPPPVAPGSGAADGPTPERLPTIQGNRRQLRDVTADALAALLARNEPPALFQRGGLLTRVRTRADSGTPYLEPLTEPALRGVLARVADWTKLHSAHGETRLEDDAPPVETVKDVAHLPDWPGVPVIEAVAECPVFGRAGQLVASPGFHPDARLWLQPAPGLAVPPVPAQPTTADVQRARDLLLTDLLGDFPWRDAASQAHTLAALLLPFVRPLVDGPTPLHLFDAPMEGTGKTLLAGAIAVVATGRPPEAMAEGSCDDEWRKRLTALLAEAPTFVLLDNLNRTLDSGALAAMLTTRMWKDRVLGVSKTATLPNTAVWLASGNNTRLSRELIRRTIWVRLDARVDAPWERTEFRHRDLLGWAQAQRGALVGAALTLCQAWVAAGRPAGPATLGMFESWAATLGGILAMAGVPGLLANAGEFRAQRADQVSEWRAFVAAWWRDYDRQDVGSDTLYALAVRDRLLDSVLGDKGERSQRTKLGHALVKAADRVYGDYRLERAGEDHSCRQRYRLVPADSTGSPVAPGSEAETCEWSA